MLLFLFNSIIQTMKWFIKAFNNAEFEGRARRREYWIFHLVDKSIKLILFISAYFLLRYLYYNPWTYIEYHELFNTLRVLFLLYMIVTIPPNISVTVRRLHDTNKSGGWWFLLAIPWCFSLFALTELLNKADIYLIAIFCFFPLIIFIYLMCKDSDKSDNKYGISPKYNIHDSERILSK